MIKISFDFDGSLDRKSLQEYATELVQRKFNVHIVTRRYDSTERYTADFTARYNILDLEKEHQYLFEVADKCGIKPENIHFMNMDDKFKFFVENEGFLWHLDDDYWEVVDINKWSKTIGISCASGSNWRHKCERLIKKKLDGKI